MYPSRKKNRLYGYQYNTPGAYFITVCTKDKLPILGTVVGVDAHIDPQEAAPVGVDAHIDPQEAAPVGVDAHIDPQEAAPVGVDAHIDPQVRLTPIGRIVEKYLRSIPGIGEYVIMPNHVHMILHISADDSRNGPMWASAPTGGDIPALIRSWKVLVTKEAGHSIWQRSYYDHVIRDLRDYDICVQYIRENPAKWFFNENGRR